MAEGDGTLQNPFNCIAVLNEGNKLAYGEVSGDYYYIKGKVVSVREEFTTQYGNGTFYISEDGTSTNQFYAYRVMYLGNKKFASSDKQVQVGDDVVVCAKITNYNGTIETAQKEGFLYELNGENRGGEPSGGGGEEGTPTGEGTLESPYNAAAAIAYCKQVGDTESPKDVYIKGKVVSVTEQYSTQYGNATFVISDDGTAATTGFTIFRALYLGNKKYTSGDQIKEGDEVIVCGKVTNYKGNTPETVQGKAFLYSLNGKSEGGDTPQPGGEAKGTGTLADPFNAAAANAYTSALAADAKSDKDIYVKGKIIDIEEKNQFNTQYGNCTFYISDDGTDSGDKFYVFRTLYLGNVKYTGGDLPKKGDEVIICGKVTNYKGNTPETVANESYIYSLNGKTEGGGTNPQPGGEVKKVTVAEFNAAAVSNDVWYELKGKVTNLKDGDIYGNFDLVDESGSVYVYGLLSEKGGEKKLFQELVAAKGIKEGSTITIIGNRGEYNGKIEVLNAYFVSIEGGGEQGGGGQGGGGEVSGNTLTVDFTAQGYENAQDITTVKLADGTTLTFSAGENKNGPKYYNSGTSIRMYSSNNFTASASKKIASIVLNCSANNAEGNITASPGSVSVNDMTVTISGINSTTTTVTNAHTGTGATSQLRISSMTITYAE